MAKTVLEGLKASTSNFMAFRLSAKLSEDITVLVNVPRFLETKFGGLRVKISSRNLVCEDRDQNCQCLAKFDSSRSQAARLGCLMRAATQAQ
ncbi:hypothetical protein HanHA300_Chr17g0645161 [Helianthus annuus]|nr:hypothetical protein HanHA300_Chr17g0645161 [Helianthus annuus]KAJ0446676.1 hypothetical protein HanHA89_Chr17g0696851 [Helianthus annuus]